MAQLASAVAIAYLVHNYNVSLERERWMDIIKSLALSFDLEKRSCPAFAGVIRDFPPDSWRYVFSYALFLFDRRIPR